MIIFQQLVCYCLRYWDLTPKKRAVENFVRKRENVGFPTMFVPVQKQKYQLQVFLGKFFYFGQV